MPVGGKLILKGGLQVKSSGVEKKKKKKKKELSEEQKKEKEEQKKVQGISVQSGKTYEEEFSLEMKQALQGKVSSTPWGSSYRAPPEVLHGYDKKIKPKNASERLDLRSAMKSDKFAR